MERLKDYLQKYSVDKKGSYTVFITMIFLSVIIFATAVIQASVQKGVQSTAESLGYLWGQSILAEQDNFLFDRYSLIAFSGDEYETAMKIDSYAGYTFDEKKYVKYEDAAVNLDGYELTDQVILRSQIERAVATGAKPIPQFRSESGDSAQGTTQNATTSANRYVSARWIINELPSRQAASWNVQSIISAIKNSVSLGSIVAIPFVNRYIMTYFKNHFSGDELGDTYFSNEVECIITGSLNDKTAFTEVKAIISAYREVMNYIHIYKSSDKKAAALSLGIILFPTLPAPLAQDIVIGIWAGVETSNDIKILEDNKPVPFVKKNENFAISLDNAINVVPSEEGKAPGYQVRENSSKGKGYVEPDVMEGESYEDYIKLILTFVPEKVLVNRILDIVQINAKYLYVDYFNVNRCYTGLDFCFTVNGKKHEFTEKY